MTTTLRLPFGTRIAARDGTSRIGLRIRRHATNPNPAPQRRGGPDFTHLWKSHSPWLNDFIHGGFGQLSSNNNLKTGAPHYPAFWFWAAMIRGGPHQLDS